MNMKQKKTNIEPRIKLSYNRNRVQAISLHTWWNIVQKTVQNTSRRFLALHKRCPNGMQHCAQLVNFTVCVHPRIIACNIVLSNWRAEWKKGIRDDMALKSKFL